MTADELQALYDNDFVAFMDAMAGEEWPSIYCKLKAAEKIALFAEHDPQCPAYCARAEDCTCNLTEALHEWEQANK